MERSGISTSELSIRGDALKKYSSTSRFLKITRAASPTDAVVDRPGHFQTLAAVEVGKRIPSKQLGK